MITEKTRIFQAVSASTVVKGFIEPYEKMPEGWFSSVGEALSNWSDKDGPENEVKSHKKLGRPRKEQ